VIHNYGNPWFLLYYARHSLQLNCHSCHWQCQSAACQRCFTIMYTTASASPYDTIRRRV